MLIAVDFDGTVVEHTFPEIGPEMPGASEVLKLLVKNGHEILLWTCREDNPDPDGRKYLQEAIDWFKEREIPLVSVNETPVRYKFRGSYKNMAKRKALFDICIDDLNLGGFPGWSVVRKKILGSNF